MPSPADNGREGGIVFGIIVVRNCNFQPLCNIAVVFAFERMRIVFRVAGNENLPPVFGDCDIDAGFGRFADDMQRRVFLNLFPVDPGMPGMRRPENIVEPAVSCVE